MKKITIALLTILALSVAPEQAALGQEVLFEIEGMQIGDNILSVASISDVDHLGRPDLLVGGAQPSTGRVWVFSTETGSVVREYEGPASSVLGQVVAALGDFDGDGVADYTAGGPFIGIENFGLVRVYSGATGEVIVDLIGTPLVEYRMGRMLDSAGDVNGDGYADLITCGQLDHARVYTGPSGQLLRTHPGPGGWPSVAGLGDIDQDGHDDYAVGWPQDSTNGCWTGRVTVYSGIDGAVIHTVFGSTPCGPGFLGDHLGLSVSRLGDINGDGVPDFLAGAPGGLWTGGGGGPGYVRAYSGLDASILLEVRAETMPVPIGHEAFGFGYRVSGGTDANGDGVPDFVVGSFEDNNGQILVEFGSMAVFSGASGEMLWKQFGPGAVTGFGREVAALADLDGDGFAEFAAGDWSWDSPDTSAGHVIVYKGGPARANRFCPAAANSTGTAARMELLGPISVGNDRLTLSAQDLPPGQFGLFVYGPQAAQTPFGDGTLCVSGALFRVGLPQLADGAGRLDHPLAFGAPPANAGPGTIQPGATWFLQCWYRDPTGPGGTGVNLSDAFEVLFAL